MYQIVSDQEKSIEAKYELPRELGWYLLNIKSDSS